MANDKSTVTPIADNHTPGVKMSVFAPPTSNLEYVRREKGNQPLSTSTAPSNEWPKLEELKAKLAALFG